MNLNTKITYILHLYTGLYTLLVDLFMNGYKDTESTEIENCL